jgi:hypothetical protein
VEVAAVDFVQQEGVALAAGFRPNFPTEYLALHPWLGRIEVSTLSVLISIDGM